ncbi:hypothetical protein [Haloarcula amylolytica]|uniref:Envelope protein N-terminal domain-containing protein n=1 Tax=Haloarcula amylolytica JCM 13557 TaxID=1227452 RepID=M0K5B8_9EURY|nr:hypothetical protein [Haloarcula amylolytica]EMA16013.1 hypothetical protein C442_18764 [Haloarcula amylolytica JCM 13557]
MSHARSILLAGLLVLSTVVTGVGPALAQTATDSGPVTYEYTGSPTTLIVDTSALDGGTEFTVEYTTQGGPSTGTTVLARETYNTANLKEDQLLFFNDGAYESVNVTVSGYSGGEPTFDSKSGLLGGINLVRTVVGTTGGDSDLTCDTSDRLGSMTSGVTYLDCTAQPGSTGVNTTGTDAQQTHIDAYQSAQNSKQQADNYHNTLDNYLSDTKTQARIIGKNAYIKALNNGSSKAAAKTEAKSAVADYYATKQENLASEWTQQATNAEYLADVMESESGLTAPPRPDSSTAPDLGVKGVGGGGREAYIIYDPSGSQTETISLVNGETTEYRTIYVEHREFYDGVTPATTHVGPATGRVNHTKAADGSKYGQGLRITAPNSNYNNLEIINFEDYSTKWAEIESQNTQVQNEMDTLAENTYNAYQSGEINNSDLVDPYVLASQQSAGDDFQGWTAAQLTLLGANSPENFDQIGSFNVTTGDGTQYEGVLFSQENPGSGQFENRTTYDTANIGGTQYVVTSDQIVELDGTFTIDRITTTRGETTENVTIQKTTYKTTNVTELKQQYDDLAKRRAEIEAREQNLRGSAGGGLLGGSSSSLVLVLVGVGTLYAVSQRRTGGNN